MKKQILYCKKCEKFTLREVCEKCNGPTITTKPAKYSPEDKWGEYRRMAKKSE